MCNNDQVEIDGDIVTVTMTDVDKWSDGDVYAIRMGRGEEQNGNTYGSDKKKAEIEQLSYKFAASLEHKSQWTWNQNQGQPPVNNYTNIIRLNNVGEPTDPVPFDITGFDLDYTKPVFTVWARPSDNTAVTTNFITYGPDYAGKKYQELAYVYLQPVEQDGKITSYNWEVKQAQKQDESTSPMGSVGYTHGNVEYNGSIKLERYLD